MNKYTYTYNITQLVGRLLKWQIKWWGRRRERRGRGRGGWRYLKYNYKLYLKEESVELLLGTTLILCTMPGLSYTLNILYTVRFWVYCGAVVTVQWVVEVCPSSRMGCCGTLLKYFLYLAVPLTALLVYFHLECLGEREQYLASKFNPEYRPDLTDCTAEMSFSKQTDELFFELGRK